MSGRSLPSWRNGTTRTELVGFLRDADQLPVEERVAVFDNDGTLWCEKPLYTQVDFFVQELRRAAASDKSLRVRPEYRAVLDNDQPAMAEMGLQRIAFSLVELCQGIGPEEFEDRVTRFFAAARHPDRGVPYSQMRYQPMLELIDELRAHSFSVYLVTGGGTEFVRAVCQSFYGVPQEGVVGSGVVYEVTRNGERPSLVRTTELLGEANEGGAKISNIQRQLGRRPILAGGNSPGDTAMLEYAAASDGPSLALVVHHDDGDREYAYESVAGTFTAGESLPETARRLGWAIASMKDDWDVVFTAD